MKLFSLFLTAVFLLASCDAIRDERGYPGGYAGRVADERTIFVRTQDQRVARFTIALAVFSAIASETVEGGTEAQVVTSYINSTYRSIALIKKAAAECKLGAANDGDDKTVFTNCAASLSEAKASPFSFETLAYDAQRSLFKLSREILSSTGIGDASRKLVSVNLAKVNPASIIDFVKAVAKNVPAARRYFATYRDTINIMADVVLNTCRQYKGTEDLKGECLRIEKILLNGTSSEVASFDDEHAAGHPLRQLENAIKSKSKNGFGTGKEWIATNAHYKALVFHIDRACDRLARVQLIDPDTSGSAKFCSKNVKVEGVAQDAVDRDAFLNHVGGV